MWVQEILISRRMGKEDIRMIQHPESHRMEQVNSSAEKYLYVNEIERIPNVCLNILRDDLHN